MLGDDIHDTGEDPGAIDTKLFDRCGVSVGPAAPDDDIGARLGKAGRESQAEAGIPAGNERHFAGKIE
jgi:hypothetical protein